MLEFLKGQKIEDVRLFNEVDLLLFTEKYVILFSHMQNCCEEVYLESGFEELQAMVGQTITSAYEDTEYCNNEDESDTQSKTWTFYNITTTTGDNCCLRFIGESNGYYSEEVDIVDLSVYREKILSILDDISYFSIEYKNVEVGLENKENLNLSSKRLYKD